MKNFSSVDCPPPEVIAPWMMIPSALEMIIGVAVPRTTTLVGVAVGLVLSGVAVARVGIPRVGVAVARVGRPRVGVAIGRVLSGVAVGRRTGSVVAVARASAVGVSR